MKQRGLERQRKLDGLRRWKFDMVLQTFSLPLQLTLFLLSARLSIYLWTIQIAIAVIVVLTCCGFAAYIFLLASAVVSPNSPFQNPLAPLILQTIQITRADKIMTDA
jgi:ABC-type multidrug transport system permease subunit